MDTAADRERRFRHLLERHRGIVLKVAASYAREAHDRDDLAQEIAAQLWRAFPKYDSARPFSTWMYRIALNVAIAALRARRDDATVPLDLDLHDAAAGDGIDAEAEQRLRLLRECIARQDPLDRALLLLWLDERSYAEIAEILGLSATNVATKLGRLKVRLRAELGAS